MSHKKDRHEINKKMLLVYLKLIGFSSLPRILTISTYKNWYTRTETISYLFNDLNIEFDDINYYPLNYTFRYLRALISLIKNIKKYDVIFIHFRGYELFFPVYIISKLYGKKLVIDYFISIRDTLCFDRKKFRYNSIIGKFLFYLDKVILHLSDFSLVDTKTHQDFFLETFGIPENRIGFLYVGCNRGLFYPKSRRNKSEKFRVFWYGSVIPLQGLEIILHAADLCKKNNKIEFVIVGPVYKKYKGLIGKLNLNNIIFVDWINYENLIDEICNSDLCLGGHFHGSIKKASRVIAGKTFQFIECGLKTVVGNNNANKELYANNNQIMLVNMGDARHLSDLILKAYNEKSVIVGNNSKSKLSKGSQNMFT